MHSWRMQHLEMTPRATSGDDRTAPLANALVSDRIENRIEK